MPSPPANKRLCSLFTHSDRAWAWRTPGIPWHSGHAKCWRVGPGLRVAVVIQPVGAVRFCGGAEERRQPRSRHFSHCLGAKRAKRRHKKASLGPNYWHSIVRDYGFGVGFVLRCRHCSRRALGSSIGETEAHKRGAAGYLVKLRREGASLWPCGYTYAEGCTS